MHDQHRGKHDSRQQTGRHGAGTASENSLLGAWCAVHLACSRSASPEGSSLDEGA